MAKARRKSTTTTRKSNKKFIQSAIKKPGALRKQLGVKKGQTIPVSKLQAAAKKKGKLGQRARFALMLRGLSKKKSRKTTTRRKRK